MKRCGYIALLGRTNAGKSTLLNACLGQKIAGVSRKPQTTRNRILGIAQKNQAQMIFFDTPGYYFRKNPATLDSYMTRQILAAIQDSDLICYLIDINIGLSKIDVNVLKKIAKIKGSKELIILISKSDSTQKSKIKSLHNQISNDLKSLLESSPSFNLGGAISAKRKIEIDDFLNEISKKIPQREWDYEEDSITDRPESFVLSEIIREKSFRLFGQEIPYGIGVKIESCEKEEALVSIKASIIVSQRSHKAIVIGKGGTKIKELGKSSRESLEKYFNKKIFLDIHVKHHENWINKGELICEYQNIN